MSHLAFFFVLMMLAASCKKNATSPPLSPPPNIYVLGQAGDTLKYWKNGAATTLYIGQPTPQYDFNGSVFVSGNDVYAASTALVPGTTTSKTSAVYWKNGVSTTLSNTTGSAIANSIYVSGNDVYVAGSVFYSPNSSVPYTTNNAVYPSAGNMATYWKNGEAVTLHTVGIIELEGGTYGFYNYSDYVSSLVVSGGDVYVAGGSHQYQKGVAGTYNFAGYWKNGTYTNLVSGLLDSSGSSITSYPFTTGMYVAGNDVYVCGTENSNGNFSAIYWQNGATVHLTNQAQAASGSTSIFILGSDVYVAGYISKNGNWQAAYWKNGSAVNLPDGGGGSQANAIFVSGSDVYIAGFQNINGVTYATYWKNGTPVNLGSNATATSIYLQ